ncbi:LmeA family phospholipid-binding protein [Streptomyces sp. CA2R106]|uniref:LmeA family phospholipid-binding protein n=1 Tax=Streptomyces sp. CA2R106 TaxID=3120153 RepID=UPI003008407B
MNNRGIALVSAVSAAVIAGAAGATDLVVEHVAEQRVVKAATCKLKPTGSVSADLEGSFAGFHALTGDLGTVRVDADGVKRQGASVDVRAVLKDVTRQGGTGGGSAAVTVPYSELHKRLASGSGAGSAGLGGMTVGSDGSALTLTGSAGQLGLPVTVETSLTTAANSLTITPTSVGVLGRDIPVGQLGSAPMAAGLADKLKPRTVKLDRLAAGAVLTSASAGTRGLVLHLSLGPGAGAAKSSGCSM